MKHKLKLNCNARLYDICCWIFLGESLSYFMSIFEKAIQPLGGGIKSFDCYQDQVKFFLTQSIFFVLNLIHVSRSSFININLVLKWKKVSQFSGEARSSSKRLSLSCSTFPSNTAVYSHVSLVTFSLQFPPPPQNPTLSTWILCSASAHLVVLLAFPWHKEIHSYHKEIKMACSEAKYEWPWPGITNLRYPQFHGSCFMKSL